MDQIGSDSSLLHYRRCGYCFTIVWDRLAQIAHVFHRCTFFNQWFNKPYSKAESFYDKWSQHLCNVLVSDFQFRKEICIT